MDNSGVFYDFDNESDDYDHQYSAFINLFANKCFNSIVDLAINYDIYIRRNLKNVKSSEELSMRIRDINKMSEYIESLYNVKTEMIEFFRYFYSIKYSGNYTNPVFEISSVFDLLKIYSPQKMAEIIFILNEKSLNMNNSINKELEGLSTQDDLKVIFLDEVD